MFRQKSTIIRAGLKKENHNHLISNNLNQDKDCMQERLISKKDPGPSMILLKMCLHLLPTAVEAK
jgi:hypothetical protein